MRRIILLILIAFIFQDCRALDIPQHLNETQIKRIAAYCKVWGFLKYYHPGVADGNINWDSVFIQIYPKVNQASSKTTYNDAILELCNRAEHAKNDSGHIFYRSEIPKGFSLINDRWMDDRSIFAENISKVLHKIKDDFKPQYNHYVSAYSAAGNPEFTQDDTFSEVRSSFPPEPMQALIISRFWNIIEYFYPDKNVIGTDWDSVLVHYIPEILSTSDATSYQLATLQLYKSINDGHAYTRGEWIDNYFGSGSVPFYISDVEGKPVILRDGDMKHSNGDSIIRSYGMHRGDIVLMVNGKNADSLRKSTLKYVQGSNGPGKMRNATSYLTHGKIGEKVVFTVTSGTDRREITAVYQNPDMYDSWDAPDRERVWRILPDNIGYVDMGNLNPDQVAHMMADLKKTKAIVFDVRNYPHGTWLEIMKYLSTPRTYVYATEPIICRPGEFHKSEILTAGADDAGYPSNSGNLQTPNLQLSPSGLNKKFESQLSLTIPSELSSANLGSSWKKYSGKIAILADEKTQSHAEFTVMALQIVPGAKTFGTLTAGADGNISTISLPGGVRTIFTGLGIFYPDGTPTQRVGVKIDYEVKPTIKGIREGKDEVLEMALKYINSGQ